MSIHASKGLEFGCVLLVGAEEGTFIHEGGRYSRRIKRVKKGEEDGAGGERMSRSWRRRDGSCTWA